MDLQTLFNLGLVLVFVLVGGVFAATELALVSLRETQLVGFEKQGRRGAHVARVARDPNRFLAAVQIGVTVAGFLSAAFGASTLAPDLVPSLRRVGLGEAAAEATALVGMTLLIAYLSLVLGELAPKRLALQRAAGISMVVAPVLDRFARLMRPVIWVLSVSTDLVVRALGGDPRATSEQLSEDELRDLVSTHEGLEEDERTILRDVFAATSTSVKEAMRPRADVTFLRGELTIAEAADEVLDGPYSRYPVMGEDFDDVIGFVHVRDLYRRQADQRATLATVVRPVLMLPSTLLVLPAVSRMRKESTHLAIVVDEYGGTDGIVTLEDLVEELLGEIRDEYDRVEPDALDGATISGGTTLEEFERGTGHPLADGPYETVAGFVIARLGRLPVVGDTVAEGALRFEVSGLEGHRITRVRWEWSGDVEAGDEPEPG